MDTEIDGDVVVGVGRSVVEVTGTRRSVVVKIGQGVFKITSYAIVTQVSGPRVV